MGCSISEALFFLSDDILYFVDVYICLFLARKFPKPLVETFVSVWVGVIFVSWICLEPILEPIPSLLKVKGSPMGFLVTGNLVHFLKGNLPKVDPKWVNHLK